MTLKAYVHPYSRGRMAIWMLEETGCAYETEVVLFEETSSQMKEYLKVNPMGQVPAIVHNGVVVTECPAVCAYLAEAFPESKLAPALGTPERAAYLRWMFFTAGPFEIFNMDKMFPRAAPPRATAISYGHDGRLQKALEGLLAKGPYALGEQFTALDVFLGSTLFFAFVTKALERTPVLQAYFERLEARPAYQKMVKLCEDMADQHQIKRPGA